MVILWWFLWDFMVVFMGFYGGLVGFYGDFMVVFMGFYGGFYGILWWFNGILW